MHHILCESPFIPREFYAIRVRPLILWHILGSYFLLIFSDISSRPWRNLPPTWVIHMATRRPAHNTPIHMDLVPFKENHTRNPCGSACCGLVCGSPCGSPMWGANTLRLLNALNSEDRGLKVRFSLATIAFDRESAQMSQMRSSQGKNAPPNPLSSLFSAFSNLKVSPWPARNVTKIWGGGGGQK